MYADFGKEYGYGTLRNEMAKLVSKCTVAFLPKEWPKRFILTKWATRPEYASVMRNDKRSTVGRFDFLSYLERVSWTGQLSVHNLKLTFLAYSFPWRDSSWRFWAQNKSWSKSLELDYPVKVECFDTGCVVVNVRCSARAFPLDERGLLALHALLVEVRCALHSPNVPDPMTWRVAHWHLNRDSEKLEGGGLDVHLTFRDMFDDSARFYYKKQLDKIRAEVSQSPKQSIKEVFEKIIDRDSFGGGNKKGV
jgi:hypothetical protein